jgi:hypothetical protein
VRPHPADLRPGHRLEIQNPLEQPQRLVKPARAHQQLRRQPCAVHPVAVAFLHTPQGSHESKISLTALQRLHHIGQQPLALSGLLQPLQQRRGGERAHDQPVQRRFRRLHHLGVRGLGGDHQEHRAMR